MTTRTLNKTRAHKIADRLGLGITSHNRMHIVFLPDDPRNNPSTGNWHYEHNRPQSSPVFMSWREVVAFLEGVEHERTT